MVMVCSSATLTSCRRGHTLFVKAGVERTDTGMEAVKPDSCCSWQSHFERVDANVGDESMKSRSVFQPLHIP